MWLLDIAARSKNLFDALCAWVSSLLRPSSFCESHLSWVLVNPVASIITFVQTDELYQQHHRGKGDTPTLIKHPSRTHHPFFCVLLASTWFGVMIPEKTPRNSLLRLNRLNTGIVETLKHCSPWNAVTSLTLEIQWENAQACRYESRALNESRSGPCTINTVT